MARTLRLYLLLFAAVIGVIIVVDMNTPRPIDWSPTYDITHKKPLGLAVFNKELDKMPQYKIERFNNTPYEYFDPLYDSDSLVRDYEVSGTILAISDKPDIDEKSATELLYFASHGNNVFLSMESFPQVITDSLGISLRWNYGDRDGTTLWLANKKLGQKKYSMNEGLNFRVIDSVRNPETVILGYQRSENNAVDSMEVNFVRVPWYNGFIYLHTQPASFSNFHLLKDDHYEYTQQVLSYIPSGTIYWSLKGQDGAVFSNSPLRYFFSQPPLRTAWFIFLVGMLAFIAFNAKRRQRIVPVITPLENTTIDFAKTIGNLYLQEGDHGNLIDKKIVYFLEKVRQDYLMDTTILDENFIKKLHSKTGKDLADIQKLVYLIKHHRRNLFTSVESDLIEINNAIEKILN